MKYTHRDTKVFTKNIATLNSEDILSLKSSTHKDVYSYENFKKIGYEKINSPKNIFQEYNVETYKVYKEISNLLNDACNHYLIDQERQNYFIKGKVFEYNKDHNNEIFDFPGRDIPIFHGFVILGEEGLKQTYYTDKSKKEFIFSKNTITLSAPTNLINNKVNNSCKVIEYYISPLSSTIQNEKNLWVPIL
jgi:hypothetical protein